VRSLNHFCGGIAITITYSECVSIALIIQHATRTRRIILSSVACPELLYFSILSHKRHDFRKKKLNIKCVFYTNFASKISNSKQFSEMYVGLYVKHPLLLWDFNETWIFHREFLKFFKYWFSRKSVQRWSNCTIRTDGETDEGNSAFSHFGELV
jgi:hypothetical protein